MVNVFKIFCGQNTCSIFCVLATKYKIQYKQSCTTTTRPVPSFPLLFPFHFLPLLSFLPFPYIPLIPLPPVSFVHLLQPVFSPCPYPILLYPSFTFSSHLLFLLLPFHSRCLHTHAKHGQVCISDVFSPRRKSFLRFRPLRCRHFPVPPFAFLPLWFLLLPFPPPPSVYRSGWNLACKCISRVYCRATNLALINEGLWPARVVQWSDHLGAMCSRAWRAQWPQVRSSIRASAG